jgi:hypothetical protein
MHGNRRYVKLTWIGLLAGLLLASPAHGELVAVQSSSAALAVGPGYRPYVAYLNGCELHVARRPAAGWRDRRVACLPRDTPSPYRVADLAVDGRGRASVLVWNFLRIVLFREVGNTWKAQTVASSATVPFGFPGLTLDRRGQPAVAYTVWRPRTAATFLRLVTLGRRGRLIRTAITQKGFPASGMPPSATPVLVDGRLHVVQAYGSSAIDWRPSGKTWEGQYLFASRLGSISGPVGAVASGGTLYAALTLDVPQFGESNVVALTSARTQKSAVVFPHALFASLTVPRTGPEVAANDFVAFAGGGSVFAGLVASPGLDAELDGRIDGYAAVAEGSRYVLLAHPQGLEFFAVPALVPVTVRLEVASAPDGTILLAGSASGGTGGEIEIYRETPGTRVLISRTPRNPDGSFAVTDLAPEPETVYRAVYRDPTTGLPYAGLLRTSCCASLRR